MKLCCQRSPSATDFNFIQVQIQLVPGEPAFLEKLFLGHLAPLPLFALVENLLQRFCLTHRTALEGLQDMVFLIHLKRQTLQGLLH